MLISGHYGLNLHAELKKISWDFKSFGFENLQQLKNILQSELGLRIAIKNGHKQAVRTFLNQLKKYCQLTPLSNSEIMIVIDILFSKRERDGCSGLLMACQKGHIHIVEAFFNVIQHFIINYPKFEHHFLNILFYFDFHSRSSLNITLFKKRFKIVRELLTWPKKLELQAGNQYITDWFEVKIERNSVFQFAEQIEFLDSQMIVDLHQFKITWILSAIKTLSDLNNYFMSNNTLSFALEHGYTRTYVSL